MIFALNALIKTCSINFMNSTQYVIISITFRLSLILCVEMANSNAQCVVQDDEMLPCFTQDVPHEIQYIPFKDKEDCSKKTTFHHIYHQLLKNHNMKLICPI